MKSDRPKKIKQRSKWQIVAISGLVLFFIALGVRFFLAFTHYPISKSDKQFINIIIITSVFFYGIMQVFYYKKKGRLL